MVKRRLGEEDSPAAPAGASPSECFAMVWPLTLDAWAMTGRPLPTYLRTNIPGRLVRLATGRPKDIVDADALEKRPR